MLKNYKAIQGQSIFDVCLNTYGTLDNLFKLLQDSSGTAQGVDDVPASGQQYTYDDALVADQQINQAYTLSGINYATYYGGNGSSMYIVSQRPPSPGAGVPPPTTPPITPGSNMKTLVDSASFISGADGTTVITPQDKSGGSLIGYDLVYIEREIRPIRRADWVWNTVTGVLTLTNGETLDNGQELFYIYTKTITS